jgi:hypothetical protein
VWKMDERAVKLEWMMLLLDKRMLVDEMEEG